MCYEQVVLGVMIIPMIIGIAMMILGPPDSIRYGDRESSQYGKRQRR